MNILITGGAGFIGSHLTELHLQQGDSVCVIDNLSSGSGQNIAQFHNNSKFNFEEADIRTTDNLSTKTLWADRIYHLAAMVGMYQLLCDPVETLTSNMLGCERLLRVIHESQSNAHLIITSTSEIYGNSNNLLLNENDMLLFKAASHSKWPYATSKFTDEILSLAYAHSKGLNVTIVRLFNTIGPRQKSCYGMVVPRFIEQALSREPITVYGSGEQVRSFCDVRDITNIINLIANNAALKSEIINVGQDQPVTINQLALMIKRLSNSESIITHINYKDAYGQDYEDIMYRRPDLTKCNQHISYTYQWDLQKTLLDLISTANKNR